MRTKRPKRPAVAQAAIFSHIRVSRNTDQGDPLPPDLEGETSGGTTKKSGNKTAENVATKLPLAEKVTRNRRTIGRCPCAVFWLSSGGWHTGRAPERAFFRLSARGFSVPTRCQRTDVDFEQKPTKATIGKSPAELGGWTRSAMMICPFCSLSRTDVISSFFPGLSETPWWPEIASRLRICSTMRRPSVSLESPTAAQARRLTRVELSGRFMLASSVQGREPSRTRQRGRAPAYGHSP